MEETQPEPPSAFYDLFEVLTPWLDTSNVGKLTTVCKSLRYWLRDTNRECRLGLLSAPDWHCMLNERPTMCQNRSIKLYPYIYSTYTNELGVAICEEVPWGTAVDPAASFMETEIVNLNTGNVVETPLTPHLMRVIKKKRVKSTVDGRVDTKYGWNVCKFMISDVHALSSKYTPPGEFKLRITLHVVLKDAKECTVAKTYSHTTEKFFVISTPPKRTSASRVGGSYTRSRYWA